MNTRGILLVAALALLSSSSFADSFTLSGTVDSLPGVPLAETFTFPLQGTLTTAGASLVNWTIVVPPYLLPAGAGGGAGPGATLTPQNSSLFVDPHSPVTEHWYFFNENAPNPDSSFYRVFLRINGSAVEGEMVFFPGGAGGERAVVVGSVSPAYSLSPVPEPSSLVLLSTGLAACAGFRKRKFLRWRRFVDLKNEAAGLFSM